MMLESFNSFKAKLSFFYELLQHLTLESIFWSDLGITLL